MGYTVAVLCIGTFLYSSLYRCVDYVQINRGSFGKIEYCGNDTEGNNHLIDQTGTKIDHFHPIFYILNAWEISPGFFLAKP